MPTEANSSDRAQDQLPSTAAYAAVAEHAPLPLALIERATLVLRDANAAFCDLLGAPRARLIGRPFVAVLPIGHENQVQALLDHVTRTGVAAPALDVQAQNGAVAGRALWTYTVWPLSAGPNDLADFVVLVTDVTAQHSDEQTVADARAINEQLLLSGLREQALVEELQHQLAFTTAITGSLGEGVYALNGVGRITYVNRAAERILAWPAGALIDSASDVTIHQQSTRGAPTMAEGSPLRMVLGGGTAYWNEDAVWARRDGTTFPAAYSLAPIVTNEQVVGVVVVFRDMTDVRRLQQVQEEYLALISHDLRTPLTVILGRAELLQRSLIRQGLEREAASVQVVIDSSDRMASMIEDLLERSRLEEGAAELRLAPIDLTKLCARVVEQDMPLDKRARITLDAEGQLV
ncbi:MAG: PAS domain-containing protein, partial [Chloroflexales bacterium]|nr:PAS domain-containing protein [Chloroflexales bacterium]